MIPTPDAVADPLVKAVLARTALAPDVVAARTAYTDALTRFRGADAAVQRHRGALLIHTTGPCTPTDAAEYAAASRESADAAAVLAVCWRRLNAVTEAAVIAVMDATPTPDATETFLDVTR